MTTKSRTDEELWGAVQDLDRDLLDLTTPTEVLDSAAKAMGLDPSALRAEGRALATALLDEKRRAWTAGHDRACLLAALSPEAGEAQSAAACPARVMPLWLAELTPWIDDSPSDDAWPHVVRRYASLARRWHVLDSAAWERARIGALLAIVEEARTHAGDDARVIAAIDGVIAWLRRGAPESERLALADAEAAAAVAAVAVAAAADRMAHGVLGAIEQEIEKEEASR